MDNTKFLTISIVLNENKAIVYGINSEFRSEKAHEDLANC